MGGRDRGKNRKQLQRGRNLSIEAIQTVQSLKRVSTPTNMLEFERVLESKFRRLLKLDMLAVLRELIRQNQPFLAWLVFEDIRKEYWYKPQLLLYTEMITMFASNNIFEKVELLMLYLNTEWYHIDADTEGFNSFFRTLMDFGFTKYALECFHFMKEVEREPNESTFKILVDGLESKGEKYSSSMVKQEAEKYFGWPIEWNEEKESIDVSLTDDIGKTKAFK